MDFSHGQRLGWAVALALGGGVFFGPGGGGTAWAQPVISEFVAVNGGGLLDEDGEPSDWIEVHNPGVEPVQLEGWSLTDDSGTPGRWRFPARSLPPGEHLVVFASGKDRLGPGPLHTNFRLDGAGEYLALVSPDGTQIGTEFAPAYPPQESGFSFGLPASRRPSNLLAESMVAFLVPGDADELSSDWAQPDFVLHGAWRLLAGGFGLGFDVTAPSGVGADVNVAREGEADQSSTGFGFGAANAIDGDPDSFTHTTSDDDQSSWWVDLGGLMEIGRIVLRNRTSCCGSRLRDLTVELLDADGSTVVWSSGLLNPENVLESPAEIVIDFPELNIGSIVARTVRVSRTPDPDLSGSGGSGNADEDNVLSLGEVEVYGVESLSFGPLIRSDLGEAMRGKNASVFVRVPFVLESPETLPSLILRLRRNDGVVAYLNGIPVLSLNAPDRPGWNAAAALARDKAEAFSVEELDLSPFRHLWRAGTNWLAFQGLNASVVDPDFLLDAELTADTGGLAAMAYLDPPTPGAANLGSWYLGRVADTKFSVTRGVYETPFSLSITSATPGAEIRYTLDGSLPTADHGERYAGPIPIAKYAVVRAAAFKRDYLPTNVDTHTYLFPGLAPDQPALPPGFPSSWAGVGADYAMDPRITGAAAYAPRMEEAMRALPSLSLAIDPDDLFGASRGIYANPERNGVAWERPVSLEWIRTNGTPAFQVDAGLRIQGGYFRNRSVTRKHSFRLLFKDVYGPGRLREDLFGEFGAAREFDTLVLRAGANDGYSWDAARDTEQFLRDEFGRRLHLAMGQPSPRGTFVHLYLNGLYWGLYNLTERPAEDFSATYLGGTPEGWDAVNSGEVKNGSLAAWNAFTAGARAAGSLADYQRLKGLNADGTPNPAYPVYLDAANYQDYMLLNIWGGNWDWPNKNFWFGRDRTGEAGGFRFYIWDFENTMGNNRGRSPLDMVTPRSGITDAWVAEPHDRLRRLEEYRMEFADRVQRHCFQNGVLTPTALVARYRELAAGVEAAVIAETARWGDDHHNPPQDLADWQRERDWLLGTYLPQRTAIVVDQLRRQGLYPQTDAPKAVPAGGTVSPTTPVVVQTGAAELFYTTDGADPRLPGGGIHPSAIRVVFGDGGGPVANPNLLLSGADWRYLDDGSDPGPGWKEPGFNDGAWLSGPSPLGYGDNDEATVVGFVDVDPAAAGVQRNATTYFRTGFQVASPDAFTGLRLALTYDDAGAVYLNGREVLRTPNLPADAGFSTYATDQVNDNTVVTLSGLDPAWLVAGRNVVAVEIHQRDSSSSDISFDLELLGELPGSGVLHSTDPLFFSSDTLLRARARQGNEWSALSEIRFTIDSEPATEANLVVSQFCYRPADASTAAELAVSVNRDDYEYLELMNIGARSVELGGVRLVAGVLYTFPPDRVLGPGQRLLLVSHRGAFDARYGTGLPVEGEYDGRLDNGGEEIAMVGADGGELRRFTYRDRSPWPSLPNDQGFALVLIRPEGNPDHSDPFRWRSSVRPGGSPGATDATRFTGDPNADLDGNGQPDFLDYALGNRPGGPMPVIAVAVETMDEVGGLMRHLVLSFPRHPAADDVVFGLEWAPALSGPWQGGPERFALIGEERTPEGQALLIYRVLEPIKEGEDGFVRLSVTLQP